MFRQIEVVRYRGLNNVLLEGLQQINVLVGENNSGKTSILEAIQLLDNTNVVHKVISVAQRRENPFSMLNRMNAFDMFWYSFDMTAMEEKEIMVRGITQYNEEYCVGVLAKCETELFIPNDTKGLKVQEELLDENGFIKVLCGNYYTHHMWTNEGKFVFREIDSNPEIFSSENYVSRRIVEMPRYISYISPLDSYTNRTIRAGLLKGMLSEEKKRLLELVRLFDERIINIETVVKNRRSYLYLEMEGQGLVPVSIFGDGLKKVLSIASTIVKMRDGVVLIDEFETGIHKYALIQVAKWLREVSDKYGVQIILTTHSGDAIDALIEACHNCSMINAYRLEHYKEKTYVKKYEGCELAELRNELGVGIL